MKKRFLSMCLFVVMCLTISSPVLAVYNDDSVVTPNNNRYYYVYEYTNYKGPKCFTVSASDAAEEAAFRAVVTTGIGALAGYYAGGNMTVTKFTADMLDRLLPQSPTYRAGYYKVYARDKIKYQVDSLDPSKRVVVDRWSCLKYELYESENSTTLKDYIRCKRKGLFRMTHHEKLVERYEDALFALMMEDVAETEGEKLQELNEQLKRDPSAEIPRELDERCIRTIRTEFGKKNFISARRGAVRVFRVISAATLIMMLLFTTAFAASPSFRAQTLTALVEMFDDHSEIRFSGTTNGAETHKMSILWMPDGYQIGLEEFDESRMIIRAEGENGENLNVAATSISKSRSYSFDTEGATEEPATVQGNEATVYQMETEDGDKITVLWTDMEKGWIVRVTGYNISKEDMLRISESVEIR